jgi:putative transposase
LGTSTPQLLQCSKFLKKEQQVDSNPSNAKDLEPYWNDFCAEISSRLSSAADLISQSSPANFLSMQTLERSWFSVKLSQVQNKNSQQIFSPSSMSSLLACTDLEDTVERSKKIRVYPTVAQRAEFTRWHDASRWCYNKTVEFLTALKGQTPDWRELAPLVLMGVPNRFYDVPYQIKKIAVRDVVRAFALNKKLVKQGKRTHFNLSWRTSKDPKQSCFIPSTALKGGGIYHTLTGKLHCAESLPDTPKDSRLIRHRGRWYLSVSHKKTTTRAETQGRVVAIDPGVRKFITLFSDNEIFGSIGAGDGGFKKLFKLGLHADRLISRMKKEPKRSRGLKRALDRLKNRISDLVDELHNKCVRFLVDTFDVIMLPTYATSQMVVRGHRKIRSKTVRAMLSFKNYQFACKLETKALEAGKMVIRNSEAYTSKTDSWHGVIHNKLGSAKRIKIGSVWVDRDVNGARGYFLRALGDTPALLECVSKAGM